MATSIPPAPAARFQFRFAGAKGKAEALDFLRGHLGTPGVGSAIGRFSGRLLDWDVTEEFVYFPLLVLLADRKHGSLRRDKGKLSPACLDALVLRVLGPERRVFTAEDSLDLPSRIDFATAIAGGSAGTALVL